MTTKEIKVNLRSYGWTIPRSIYGYKIGDRLGSYLDIYAELKKNNMYMIIDDGKINSDSHVFFIYVKNDQNIGEKIFEGRLTFVSDINVLMRFLSIDKK